MSTYVTTNEIENNYKAISSSYSAFMSDGTVNATATSAITITLPSASTLIGKTYTIRKADSSTNAVTLATSSSQTINGSSTYTLGAQYKYVVVQSDGSNWMVIGNN